MSDRGPNFETLIVRLPGEWDMSRQEELRKTLEEARERPNVVLDLTDTTYIDSAVLTELAKMRQYRVGNRNFEPTHIVAPRGNIARLLSIVGFDRVFPTHESLPDALRSQVLPADEAG